MKLTKSIYVKHTYMYGCELPEQKIFQHLLKEIKQNRKTIFNGQLWFQDYVIFSLTKKNIKKLQLFAIIMIFFYCILADPK